MRELKTVLGIKTEKTPSEIDAERQIKTLRSKLAAEHIGLRRAIHQRTKLMNEIIGHQEK